MAPSLVRVHGDSVCFTLPNEEFKRADKGIVYGGYYVSEKDETIWGYHMPPVPFKEGECYKYGDLPMGAKVGEWKWGLKLSETAPVLRYNILYSVWVLAQVNDPYDPTRGFSTEFCLKKQNDLIVVEQGKDACKDIKNNIGSTEIRVQGDKVCFALPREEFKHANGKMMFRGYSVTKGEKDIWGYIREPVMIEEGDCLEYGHLPDGAIVEATRVWNKLPDIAPTLHLNSIYYLNFKAKINDPHNSIQGYATKFCLKKQNDSIVVEQGQNACRDNK